MMIQSFSKDFEDKVAALVADRIAAALLNGQAAKAPTTAQAAKDTPGKPPSRPQKAPQGRLARRTDADIDNAIQAIVNVLKANPNGLRSEELRAALDVDKKELPKPLAVALERGLIFREGQKRATTYSVSTHVDVPEEKPARGPGSGGVKRPAVIRRKKKG